MGHWYAVRTATRREEDAAFALADQGMVIYLPFETRWRITPRTKEAVNRPLLSGYLFVVVRDDDDFHPILETTGVHQFVRSIDFMGVAVPMRIPSFAIEGIMAEEWSGRFDYTRPSVRERNLAKARTEGYAKGQQLMVTEGDYAGLMVEVLKMTSSNRRAVVWSPAGQRLNLDVEHLDAA